MKFLHFVFNLTHKHESLLVFRFHFELFNNQKIKENEMRDSRLKISKKRIGKSRRSFFFRYHTILRFSQQRNYARCIERYFETLRFLNFECKHQFCLGLVRCLCNWKWEKKNLLKYFVQNTMNELQNVCFFHGGKSKPLPNMYI
jgi:hypothetical protein